MSLKICHISDTHSYIYHEKLVIPTDTDVLVHTGDVGMRRTSLKELTEFLIWYSQQPGRLKIFVPGNHDTCLDKNSFSGEDTISRMLEKQTKQDAQILLESYPEIKYLNNKDYIFEGIKFYGSPYSPTFGHNWAFNADRGEMISKQWAKIPSDVNVLLTHTPVYRILDNLKECTRDGEDPNAGCQDLLAVIKKRLFNLKLHCSGHIHDNVGITLERMSNTRRVLFSNGAIVSNAGEQLVTHPLIITI